MVVSMRGTDNPISGPPVAASARSCAGWSHARIIATAAMTTTATSVSFKAVLLTVFSSMLLPPPERPPPGYYRLRASNYTGNSKSSPASNCRTSATSVLSMPPPFTSA